MAENDFIKNKLSLMTKDKQTVFDKLVDPLQEMALQGERSKKIRVPADGNWFSVSFDAVEVKKDRLVISAKRIIDGLTTASYNPSEKRYIVEFEGTRAAYLRGFYEPRHPVGGWPYIAWDIRSYANHPTDSAKRVYVQDFRAHAELRKLILAMESMHGTSNIYNKYINDNLTRFKMGIQTGKTPQEIEKTWSKGLMEGLGYRYVEAEDTGHPKGKWNGVSVHWCKKKHDLRG
jgi:hypothetical protein